MGLDYVILEAWSQGFLVGGLVILIMITLANIRKGVLFTQVDSIRGVYAVYSLAKLLGLIVVAPLFSRPWDLCHFPRSNIRLVSFPGSY